LVLTDSSTATGEVVLAVGECKQPSVLSLQPPQEQQQQLGFRQGQGTDAQLAAEQDADRTDLVERWHEGDLVARAVLRQVFSYMANASVGFGVLTVVEHTWLLRRTVDKPSTLQVSRRTVHVEACTCSHMADQVLRPPVKRCRPRYCPIHVAGMQQARHDFLAASCRHLLS
jgi:hypothetical protein